MQMNVGRLSLLSILGVGLIALLAGGNTASAGILNGHPQAYNDGVNPTWTGSTPFTVGSLSGFVDYAVFAPGVFPFAGGGYTPTAGELTYTYQVTVTGTASLSLFSMALSNPADNIGTFNNIGTKAPTLTTLTPLTSADWSFVGNNVQTGQSTFGLVFSSLRKPMNLFGTVVDTGQSTFVVPLPSPGPNNIPEPMALSVVALVAALPLRRRPRR